MDFPKLTQSNLKGLKGQAYFQNYVYEYLKCLYHPIHEENDFGLDGRIEIAIDGKVTGKLIGVQIKHGNSYFEKKTKFGYRYEGKQRHLNYYINNPPIYIVIIDDDCNRMKWVKFDINKTNELGEDRWWIEIPEENNLKTNFKNAILSEADEIIDYEEEILYSWLQNDGFKESDFRILAIPKKDILSNTFDTINDYIKRMSVTKEMLINSRNTVAIFFPEYSNDIREITEIPEIMNWLKNSIDIGIPWFLFLNYKIKNSGINFLVHSYCKVIRTIKVTQTTILYEYDKFDIMKFIDKNLDNLKKFIKKNNLEEGINEEIAEGILRLFE